MLNLFSAEHVNSEWLQKAIFQVIYYLVLHWYHRREINQDHFD